MLRARIMATRPEAERRRLQRVDLKGRVHGRFTNGGVHEVRGVSKNVSAEGMFVLLESEVIEGSRIELVMELPSQHVFRDSVTLRCVGKVIRKEAPGGDGLHGVAVLFEDVEIVSQS